MQETPLSKMRHAARGYLNAVKLCVSAMELDCTYEEHLEFVTDVISSSDKMITAMQDLEEYFELNPVPDEQAASNS